MEVRFNICDNVVFLNTVTGKLDSAEVKRIQILPTGISKDENGKNVLDGSVVMYETVDGPVLAESEVFASKEEAKARLEEILKGI